MWTAQAVREQLGKWRRAHEVNLPAQQVVDATLDPECRAAGQKMIDDVSTAWGSDSTAQGRADLVRKRIDMCAHANQAAAATQKKANEAAEAQRQRDAEATRLAEASENDATMIASAWAHGSGGGPTPAELDGQRLAQEAGTAIVGGSRPLWKQVNVISRATTDFEITLYYKAVPATRDEVRRDLEEIQWRLFSTVHPQIRDAGRPLTYTIQALKPVANPEAARADITCRSAR